MTIKIRKNCPTCETLLDTTMYKEEGGYCEKCKTWMVPESSRWGIINARGLDEYLLIQFYDDVTGKLTHTWKEYRKLAEDED